MLRRCYRKWHIDFCCTKVKFVNYNKNIYCLWDIDNNRLTDIRGKVTEDKKSKRG